MVELDNALVRRLVADQFPQWAHLPVRPVPKQGNDNRTFRLGDELTVRLPSAEGYVAGVAKEDAALPRLARHLSVSLPRPVVTGVPGADFPWPWSVRRGIVGTAPEDDPTLDRIAFGHDVGTFFAGVTCGPRGYGSASGRALVFPGMPPVCVFGRGPPSCRGPWRSGGR